MHVLIRLLLPVFESIVAGWLKIIQSKKYSNIIIYGDIWMTIILMLLLTIKWK